MDQFSQARAKKHKTTNFSFFRFEQLNDHTKKTRNLFYFLLGAKLNVYSCPPFLKFLAMNIKCSTFPSPPPQSIGKKKRKRALAQFANSKRKKGKKRTKKERNYRRGSMLKWAHNSSSKPGSAASSTSNSLSLHNTSWKTSIFCRLFRLWTGDHSDCRLLQLWLSPIQKSKELFTSKTHKYKTPQLKEYALWFRFQSFTHNNECNKRKGKKKEWVGRDVRNYVCILYVNFLCIFFVAVCMKNKV